MSNFLSRLAGLTTISLIVMLASVSRAQVADSSAKIKFYLSCQTCDPDYLRRTMSYVDFVRDPAQAEVHAFVIREFSPNGGARYTVVFLGQQRFEGLTDTLRFTDQETTTPDEVRSLMTHTLGLGLARYVAHSAQADRLALSFQPADTTSVAVPKDDPWDSWVIGTDIEAYLSGEQLRSVANYWGSLYANRTTEALKVKLSTSGSYYENRFEDLDLTSISRSGAFYALVVWSLSDHWSLGPSFGLSTSSYTNTSLLVEPQLGLEYDVYPYRESTSRQLRLLYTIGVRDFHYADTTIFDKLHEMLASHTLSASLIFQKPWGSIETDISASQYLYDLTKNHLNVYETLQLRLFEGLSLRLQGQYSSIHDQLSLDKAGLTDDEILLQRQQLATNYSYWTSVGFTYTFGSIYNNVVNPRFGN